MHISCRASSRSFLPFAAGILVLLARPAAAQYGTLNLASGDIVTVTGAGTISNRAGGSNTTSAYDAGENFSGVDAEAGSTFNLAGGSITGEAGDSAIYASGAMITVSSGSVFSSGSGTDGLDAANGSMVTISGGSFIASSTSANALSTQETPNATPGAPLSAIDVYADSQSNVSITGGTFSAASVGTVSFFAINSGVINLFGTGFTVNGRPVTGPITTGSGTISGTLLNGNVLTNLPYTVLGGAIQFTPMPATAPEPSAWAALAIGVFGIGLLRLCKSHMGRQSASTLSA